MAVSSVNVINQVLGERFALYNGDSVEVLKGIPDATIDYAIYSPRFLRSTHTRHRTVISETAPTTGSSPNTTRSWRRNCVAS